MQTHNIEHNIIADFAARDTRTTEPLPELFKHRGRGTEIDI